MAESGVTRSGLQTKAVIVNGTILEGEQFDEYCKKYGMCTNCGLVQTHHVKRNRFGLRTVGEPIAEKKNSRGDYEVYKGYCLQPTCYTLEQAKRALGEPTKTQFRDGRRQKPKSNEGILNGSDAGDLLTPGPGSDHSWPVRREDLGDKCKSEPVLPGSSPLVSPQDIEWNPASSEGRMFFLPATINSLPPPPLREEELSDNEIIERLQAAAEANDYNSLLHLLDTHKDKLGVAITATQLLREVKSSVDTDESSSCYVFDNQETWIKTLKTAMKTHLNVAFQKEAVLTLWYLCSLSPLYVRDVVQVDGAADILKALELQDPALDTLCCGALACLTRDENEGIQWGYESRDVLIRSVSLVIADNSRGGRDSAISTLSNLSVQAAHNDAQFTLLNEICEATPGGQWLEELILALNEPGLPEKTAEEILWFLWTVSAAEEAAEVEPLLEAVPNLLTAASTIMSNYETASLHEAACGLVSNLALFDSVNSISTTAILSSVNSLLNCLRDHQYHETVQASGVHALTNLLSRMKGDPLRAVAETALVVILEAMKNWSDNRAIKLLGCRGLAYICKEGEDMVEAVAATSDGIRIVFGCLTNDEQAQDSPETLELNHEALNVCILFSSFPMAASQLVEAIFEITTNSDGLPDFVKELVTSMATTTASSDATECDGRLAKLVSELIPMTESEETIVLYMESLLSMTYASTNAVETLIGAVEGRGLEQIMTVLERFPRVEAIQAAGCGILSNVYAKEPQPGSLDQTIQLQDGTDTTATIRTASELRTLKKVMKGNKSKHLVLENALTALNNFFVGIKLADASLPTGENAESFSGLLKETLDVFSVCEENRDVQESALRCIQSLVCITDPVELKRWVSHLIDKVFSCMKRFQQDVPMHQQCCRILLWIARNRTDDDTIMADIGGETCVVSLFYTLLLDNEELAYNALQLISSLLDTVFTFSGEMLDRDGFIDSIIRCLSRHPDSPRTQTEACSILAAVATQNTEFYIREMIAMCGWTEIVKALQGHPEDELLQVNACRALAAISTSIPKEMLVCNSETLLRELMRALNDFPEAEELQSAVLDAFWGLCANDDSFKETIVAQGGIESIIKAMERCLGSLEVQKSGCSILWVLATESVNKYLIGATGGLHAIFNAMLAHIASTALQKEALTALRNLSAVSENKVYLQQVEGNEVVALSMWTSMSDPSVISRALSALNNMAVDASTREVTRMSDSLLECILMAMSLHRKHGEVQKNACFLLSSYSFNIANMSIMTANRQRLANLLEVAAIEFPDDCGERAQKLIRKL